MTIKKPPRPPTAAPPPPTPPKPRVRTYAAQTAAVPPAGVPTSLFDPAWNDPQIAARVAFLISRRLPEPDPATTMQPPPTTAPTQTDERAFVFPGAIPCSDGTRLKGGSFGELHRRYVFGAQTANFHAQAVAFGVDDRGTFFLTATVGRFDGPWGNEGLLAATFFAGDEAVGTVSWRRGLDPVGDHKVVVCGRDPRVRSSFAAIDRARVVFSARTGVVAPGDDGGKAPARLSRARRAALESELKSALDAKDEERARRLFKVFSGLHDADVEGLLSTIGDAAVRASVRATVNALRGPR